MPSMVQLKGVFKLIRHFYWLRDMANQRDCINSKPRLIQFSFFSMAIHPNNSWLQCVLTKHRMLVLLLLFQLLANQKHHLISIQNQEAVMAHLVVLGIHHLLNKNTIWCLRDAIPSDLYLRMHCSNDGKSSS